VTPTTNTPHPSFTHPSEAEIQHAAYLLWIETGRLPGHDLENWFAAKELLRHRHAPGAGARHPAPNVPPAEADANDND
jgi:hypothetical protein